MKTPGEQATDLSEDGHLCRPHESHMRASHLSWCQLQSDLKACGKRRFSSSCSDPIGSTSC